MESSTRILKGLERAKLNAELQLQEINELIDEHKKSSVYIEEAGTISKKAINKLIANRKRRILK